MVARDLESEAVSLTEEANPTLGYPAEEFDLEAKRDRSSSIE